MPEINNISNVNNLDSKRAVSKLSFQVGEVFGAKVVEVSNQGNEVVLKTTDGWQFTANAKIPLENLPKGLVKFKVVGYEDGKLQIVIVPETAEGSSAPEKSIQIILKQQNLSANNKADLEILKSMVSHNIPLTKENISYVKTIIDFKEKISANTDEEDRFISKYLQSKGIDINSVQGKNITALLKGFFSELKKASVEDLVTLKENGLEITEDNLKSFNKVFKEDTGLYKQITEKMNKEALVNNSNINSSINTEKSNTTDLNIQSKPVTEENNLKTVVHVKDSGEKEGIVDLIEVKTSLDNKVDNKANNGVDIKKEIVKSFLDAVIEDDGIKNNLIVDDKTMESNSKAQVQNPIKTEALVSKDTQELKIIQNIIESDIPITKENVSIVKAIIDLKEEILSQPKNETEVIKQYLISKDIPEDGAKGKALNNTIKEFFDTIKKEPIKEVLLEIKSNTDGKTFNNEFKEDLPVFKEIIKNILKDNDSVKSIDIPKDNRLPENIKSDINSNIKSDIEPIKEVLSKIQPSTAEKNQGTDERVFDKPLKEDFPVFKDIIKDIFKGNDLTKGIEFPKNNELLENIKNEIAQKTDFMKDIIKTIREGDMSLIKSSINDIKVFNTVSNQYYYMDVPVNVNQRQYECKLLIKDDRKKGKKIDSKNVKMFVSVKTINMGKVDAYIKVSDRNVSIDLKCNENFLKVFENENNKLVSCLQDMNYNVNLKIEKRVDDANIVTTREFFQDNAIGSINVMV